MGKGWIVNISTSRAFGTALCKDRDGEYQLPSHVALDMVVFPTKKEAEAMAVSLILSGAIELGPREKAQAIRNPR